MKYRHKITRVERADGIYYRAYDEDLARLDLETLELAPWGPLLDDPHHIGLFQTACDMAIADIRSMESDIPKLPFECGRFMSQEHDVPWPYELELGYRGRKNVKGYDVSVPYEEWSMQQLYQWGEEVNRVAAQSCHLWMWTTDAFEKHAIELMDAWGFPKVRTFVWVKTTKAGKPYARTGHWSKMGHELLMLGTNDRSFRTLNATRESSVFFAPVPGGKHSAKPPEAYELIRRNSPGPRLSAFQRTPREGFDCWGNQLSEEAETNGR